MEGIVNNVNLEHQNVNTFIVTIGKQSKNNQYNQCTFHFDLQVVDNQNQNFFLVMSP